MTLPGALVLLLAAQGDWVAREVVAAALWPDASPGEAQHRLRLTLHRCRALLSSWGHETALNAERSRLRLRLPTDLDLAADPERAEHLLAGFRLAGVAGDGLRAWVESAAGRQQAAARSAQADDGRHAHGSAPKLPGRDGELQRLTTLTQGARAAVTVVGPSGIGKTTLLRALWPRAPWLQCHETLRLLPYRPLLELLRGHADRLRATLARPGHPLAAHRLDLARLLPEWAPGEPLPPLDALTARARLDEALVQALEALGPQLAVDDLGWCDDATLTVLGLLAHRGRTRWCATLRGADHGDDAPSLVRALRDDGSLALLPLGGMGAQALAAAFGRAWPEAGPGDWESLAVAAGGNPFVASQWVRARQGTAGEAGPPRHLQAVTDTRLARLTPDAGALLAALAVLESPHPLALAGGVARLAPQAAEQAAGELLQAHLAEAVGERVHCQHDLVRQAALARLPTLRRRALHARVAQALESGFAGQDGTAEVIAQHWREAGEAEQALRWMHRGAQRHKAQGRLDAARQCWAVVEREARDPALALEAVIALAQCDLFERIGSGRARLESALQQVGGVRHVGERLRLHALALAGLVDHLTFTGAVREARPHAAVLQSLLGTLGEAEASRACEALLEVTMRTPGQPGVASLLDQLRRHPGSEPQALNYAAQAAWYGGRLRQAREGFEALLRQHPAHAAGLTAERDLAVVLHAQGELGAAEALARRSLAHWRGVGHCELLSWGTLGAVLTTAGRWDEAREALGHARRLADDQGSRRYQAEVLMRQAELALARGKPVAAEPCLLEAVRLLEADACDEPLPLSLAVQLQAWLAVGTGCQPPPGLEAEAGALAAAGVHPLARARVLQARRLLAGPGADGQALQAELERLCVAEAVCVEMTAWCSPHRSSLGA